DRGSDGFVGHSRHWIEKKCMPMNGSECDIADASMVMEIDEVLDATTRRPSRRNRGRRGTFLVREEFQTAMSELARLRRHVDDFFDKVTVNCDDTALRDNR